MDPETSNTSESDPAGVAGSGGFIDGNVFGLGATANAFGVDAVRDVTADELAARRAADAVRRLIAALSATSASIDELDLIAQSVDAIVNTVPVGEPDELTVAGDFSVISATAIRQSHRLRERSPFIGMANPVAPPMHVMFTEDVIEATVTLGSLYEGPPGCVHGGFVAAMFDAFYQKAEVTTEHLERSLAETVPLSRTMKEKIADLRTWCRTRARPASSAYEQKAAIEGGRNLDL